MAITEDFSSREETLTVRGQELVQRLTMTWAEWDVQSSVPLIGSAWSEFRLDLRLVRVTTEAIDNTNCRVVAIYNTRGAEFRQERPDQIASWNENISIMGEENSTDSYFDLVAGWKSWPAEWLASGPGTPTDENRPNNIFYGDGKMRFAVSVYGSVTFVFRVYDNHNKINASPFLVPFYIRKNQVLEEQLNDVTADFDDTRAWLFQGANMNRIGSDVLKYDFMFISAPYDGIVARDWQKTRTVPTNQYVEMDFMSLFDGMDFDEPDTGHGLRGV